MFYGIDAATWLGWIGAGFLLASPSVYVYLWLSPSRTSWIWAVGFNVVVALCISPQLYRTGLYRAMWATAYECLGGSPVAFDKSSLFHSASSYLPFCRPNTGDGGLFGMQGF